METSIKTINGELYTVIWRGIDNAIQLLDYRYINVNGVKEFFAENNCLTNLATALPALPKNPKPEDTALLYRYMSEGIFPQGIGKDILVSADDWLVSCRIDGETWPLILTEGAHTINGNRVEIAIKAA